ncbi:hypothetical protein [Moorella sp. Hama-1]|uniref:hypothetical protein n=1 Tax=Moorella sp. Hama-1 TaxID=2138101 RepID=UPI000D6567BA|nr:hypothetical protein [Moorella sp. Hama-1]BCV20345.1 hypothetical protein hamaS1_04140 [Moorella sp. Hama-1]
MDNEKFQELVLQQFSKVHDKLDSLEKGQRAAEIRLENEVIQKIGALFDARSVQEDINARIFSTLERIEAKIDVLQMETAHIRRVK